MHSQTSYLEKLGQRILAEANDLKRTPEALARELGYELSVIKSAISGRADLEVVQKEVQSNLYYIKHTLFP